MTSFISSDLDSQSIRYAHTIPEAGRLVPSASKWNSIQLDFNLVPQSNTNYFSISSQYSKSYDYELVITDKKYFKRFVYISVTIVLAILAIALLLHFLPQSRRHSSSSRNLTLALSQALMFFDAQKSGNFPSSTPVRFRGNSGLQDGNLSSPAADLVGGFYDSGNNMKFSFTSAYTVTLLSWSVIEYHEKYAAIGELDHVKDIIRWGSDYLLKVFPHNSTLVPIPLYSQVGTGGNDTEPYNDMSCWQRPEHMEYPRPVSSCDSTASDLAGEIMAALSSAAIVFKNDADYSGTLIRAAEKLFGLATKNDTGHMQGPYTAVEDCGGKARKFYNSSGFMDELVWGGTWLFFATGNTSYLGYATGNFTAAEAVEGLSEKGFFYWNNKLPATAVLLARLRSFRDLGYPYEPGFKSSSNMANSIVCSYASDGVFNRTPGKANSMRTNGGQQYGPDIPYSWMYSQILLDTGGLILLDPGHGESLQFAATASFLSKLYSDYLQLLGSTEVSCGTDSLSLESMRKFSRFQVRYILGDNPMKMSYMVGFGNKYPTHVHHRAASIPWDGRYYSCEAGQGWLFSKDPNPNILYGAMVAGPDQFDNFLDKREQPWFTEPTIASNAGLVAALIALHDPPRSKSNGISVGIDKDNIFEKCCCCSPRAKRNKMH